MSYQISLDSFQGPFDLLLYLIDKNEVDIYDIPIAEITRQYLEYLEVMQQMDLEIASEFLVMAATLLSIKAKMLVPKPRKEEETDDDIPDAREELVRDLLEYKKIKEASALLANLEKQQSKHFSRPNEESFYLDLFGPENPLDGRTLQELQNAFLIVWRKASKRAEVQSIQREGVTVGEQMKRIKGELQRNPQGLLFSSIFIEQCDKMFVIVCFLALLELIRQGLCYIRQEEGYGPIYIFAA